MSLERGITSFAFQCVEGWRGFHIIKLGCVLQRLFSTFPNSWPGFGLLLLRLGVGIALIYLGMSRLFSTPGGPITVALDLVEATGGGRAQTQLLTLRASGSFEVHRKIAFGRHITAGHMNRH